MSGLGIRCPHCGKINNQVSNTRYVGDLCNSVKRSRKCISCGNTFITYEVYSKKALEVHLANYSRKNKTTKAADASS